MVVARVLRIWSIVVYAVLGVGVWFALLESGVHATLAGVAIGLLAPATPLLKEEVAREFAARALEDRHLDADELARLRFLLQESVSVVERLIGALHPVSAYVVLPIFALANAGVELGAIGEVFTEPVGLGIILGLVARQADRHLRHVLPGRTPRHREAARGHLLADGARPRRGRRHRLHRLDLHRRAVVPRRRAADGGGEDRDPAGLAHRRGRRRRAAARRHPRRGRRPMPEVIRRRTA